MCLYRGDENMYLPLLKGSWNMQEHWDSDIFWLMTVESVGFSRHFAFCSLGNRPASSLSLGLKTACFEAHLLSSWKNLTTLFPTKLQGFHWTLLYHFYSLHTATGTNRETRSAEVPRSNVHRHTHKKPQCRERRARTYIGWGRDVRQAQEQVQTHTPAVQRAPRTNLHRISAAHNPTHRGI